MFRGELQFIPVTIDDSEDHGEHRGKAWIIDGEYRTHISLRLGLPHISNTDIIEATGESHREVFGGYPHYGSRAWLADGSVSNVNNGSNSNFAVAYVRLDWEMDLKVIQHQTPKSDNRNCMLQLEKKLYKFWHQSVNVQKIELASNIIDNVTDYVSAFTMANFAGRCYMRYNKDSMNVMGADISTCEVPRGVLDGWAAWLGSASMASAIVGSGLIIIQRYDWLSHLSYIFVARIFPVLVPHKCGICLIFTVFLPVLALELRELRDWACAFLLMALEDIPQFILSVYFYVKVYQRSMDFASPIGVSCVLSAIGATLKVGSANWSWLRNRFHPETGFKPVIGKLHSHFWNQPFMYFVMLNTVFCMTCICGAFIAIYYTISGGSSAWWIVPVAGFLGWIGHVTIPFVMIDKEQWEYDALS